MKRQQKNKRIYSFSFNTSEDKAVEFRKAIKTAEEKQGRNITISEIVAPAVKNFIEENRK